MSDKLTDACELAFWKVLSDALAAVADSDGVAYLKDQDGVTILGSILTGKNFVDKLLPLAVCDADGEGEEEPRGTGNFWVRLSIMVKSTAVPDPGASGDGSNPKSQNLDFVQAVSQAIQNVADLPAALNAAAVTLGIGFTAFPNGVIRGAPTKTQDAPGAVWDDEFTFRVYCCASTLTG